MVFRARTVAELFDQTIRSYRHRFKQYFIVAAVGLLPGMLLSAAALAVQSYITIQIFPELRNADPTNVGSFSTYSMANSLASVMQNLASLLEMALSFGLVVPLVNIVFLADLQGEAIGLREALRRFKGVAWNLVAVFAVLFGVYLAAIIWLIVPCVGWFTGLPMLVAFGTVAPMTVTIAMVEGRQAWAAVKRAWLLVRQRLWATVGALWLIGLFEQAVMVGPLAVLAMIVLLPLQGMGYNDLNDLLPAVAGGSVGAVLTTSLTSVLVYPLSILFTGHWYLDLRTRFEALDLSLRAQERAGVSTQAALRAAPDIQAEKFLRGQDLGQFFLMSLALIAFFIALWGALVGVIFALQSLGGR